jgi:hypothetical protein
VTILYLAKKNDDVISHCKCEESFIGEEGQLDCPWCGCGWLFSCLKCRKAFTFAEAVKINKTWEELAREDLMAFYKRDPNKIDIEEWVQRMQYMTSHIKLGETYVYLDGCFIPAKDKNIEFEGLYANHKFNVLPQVSALENNSVISSTLENPEYWYKNTINQK